uniref:Uncharacterized protein n=1 Tax=Alexandrium catenella TaxID=2925 RepID=A0A7S1KVM3_ALECA|mmetsp:Transcript_100922/g.268288  ORF Transcript_100922/g.268288 Transcript_100922/m.268288 type:complete len:177 (+) Transcript_100922:71-601(+)
MVKILPNGDIVPDSDPRASQASVTQRKPQGQQGFGAQPARVKESPAAASSQGSAGAGQASGLPPPEENIIAGDLARVLGIHGQKQVIMGREVPLIYLLVGAVLALLWISGQTGVIRVLVMGFVLYAALSQYRRAQAAGGAGGGGGGGLGGFFGGGSGDDSSGGGSGGSVINPGRRQ